MIEDVFKTYFNPGDHVKCRHFENAPEMYVVEKMTRTLTNKSGDIDTTFLGIKCRWFSTDNALQEAIFSTKDLIHTNEE